MPSRYANRYSGKKRGRRMRLSADQSYALLEAVWLLFEGRVRPLRPAPRASALQAPPVEPTSHFYLLSRLPETNDQISRPEVGKSLDIKGKTFVISRPLTGGKRVYFVAITGFADLVSWRCDCGPIPRGSACRGRRRWKTSETNISRWGRFAWTLPLS